MDQRSSAQWFDEVRDRMTTSLWLSDQQSSPLPVQVSPFILPLIGTSI
jgi:hypothetical protein